MKRFVALLCLLFLVSTGVSAQVIPGPALPEEFISDYLGPLEPADIHAELLAWSGPWSLPDVIGTHLMYGEIIGEADQVEMQYTAIARLFCDGLPACVAIHPTRVDIAVIIPWDYDYGTYISIQPSPYHWQMFNFSALSVSLGHGIPYAHWYTGTFDVVNFEYVVNYNYPYTEYLIYPVIVPIWYGPLAVVR